MARNQSEKIPYPELHPDIHRYFDARWGGSGEADYSIWRSIDPAQRLSMEKNWNTEMHKELVIFYQGKRRARRLKRI